MIPGRADQEPAAMPPRLVPQSDGYADYVDQTQPHTQGLGQYSLGQYGSPRGQQASRAGYAGHRRKGRKGLGGGGDAKDRASRQRSIRSTIMILLVIPLLSLIALWAYAATSTVGGAIVKRNSDTVNKDIGGPLQGLITALGAERTDTFIWLSAHGRLPHTTLDAQRVATDKSVAAFRVGSAAAAGLTPDSDKAALAALLAKLNQLPALRAQVNAGTIPALTAFNRYNDTEQAVYPYINGSNDPQQSLPAYQEGQAADQISEGIDAIGQEAALVGGVLASGGIMSATEYRQFVQTVDNQRLFEQIGNSPTNWQANPDTYLVLFQSRAFATFQALENKIIAMRPPARLPVSPAAWQGTLQSLFTQIGPAETAFRTIATRGQAHEGDIILLRLILVGGAGLVAVIVSSILLLGFGNRISRELTGLRGAARTLAGERLPSVVSRLRAGDNVDVAAEAPPLDLGTKTREVTETADAFSAVQRTAVEAAVEQAQLRKGVSMVFRSLSRRNQSLLQRQLRLLDEMERGTEDPDALEQLFRLDHLTTRMRRQAEGLIILSGASPGRAWRQPVPVVEMLRGAIGEIEDYARVDLVTDSPDFLQGTAVADVTHILAELAENAVQYSPPGTRVQVRGGRVANGYCIEVEDRGLGIPIDTMSVLNERLARPPEFDLADSDQLGLFVVSRLAARHGVKVSLRISGYGGTTAIVLLPRTLVVAEEEVPFLTGTQADSNPADTPASPGRPMGAGSAAEALAGRRRLRPERAPGPAFPAGGLTDRYADSPVERPAAAGSLRTLPSRDEGSRDSGLPSRRSAPQDAQPSAAGSGGLPRRQAGTNLAPQLKENRPGAPKGPLAGRSPEQARALMSAIQQGWRSGRGASTSPEDDEGPGTAHGWNE
jgi:signal transduction histidine kinase